MDIIRDIVESYRELYINGKDIQPEDAALLRTVLILLKKYDHESSELLPGIDIIFKGSADAQRTRTALRSLLKQVEFPKDRNSTADGDARILTSAKKLNFKEFLSLTDDLFKKCQEYEQTLKRK